ncbi:MAG: hypothetical protein V3U37_03910 [Nitrospinaceae bacterium]
MERDSATVEDVREAQVHFQEGSRLHEEKDFNRAIETFKKTASVCPYDEKHLEELQKKLKGGSYKLQQESTAYMGCAAVHLNSLINELDDDQKKRVPVDEHLIDMFKGWDQ